jgi:hypothetical protein
MARAFAAHERFTDSLPAQLGERFRRVCSARLDTMNGARSFASGVTAPAATPFIALLEACRRDLGLSEADPRLEAIGEATLALYVYVRIQDDLVDEPARFDRGCVYIAEAFAGRSARAFADALGGCPAAGPGEAPAPAAFFAFRERAMLAFARVAVWEIDVFHEGRAGGDEEERRVGEKFLPMAVPLGALCFLAGRPDRAEGLLALVATLGAGLQVMNDLLNLTDDHLGRRLTPVLRRLYREGRAAPGCNAAALHTAVLASDEVAGAIAWARAELAQAARIAAAHGLPRVAEVARGRGAFLEEIPAIVVARCLRGVGVLAEVAP